VAQVGFLDRITQKLRQGTAAAFAPAVDPRPLNVSAHQKQRALLVQVSGAIQDVIAARGRLEASAAGVRAKLPALQDQARDELRAGRKDMARLALQRRQVAAAELRTLDRQLAEVQREEVALSVVQQRLSAQIEAFAARQQVIRARYSAAEAQVRINEAMTGVSADFESLTAALQRAEERTETLQARATAIDRLVQEGDLESLELPPGDDVEVQLAALESDLTEKPQAS
jgi:phage shock protein A